MCGETDKIITDTIIHKINRSSNNLLKYHFISFVELLFIFHIFLMYRSIQFQAIKYAFHSYCPSKATVHHQFI